MSRTAVFPEVNALPRAKGKPAAHNRNGKIDGGERRPNVRRHIVLSFRGMNKQRVTVRHQPGEKAFQVAPHVRVGILLDQQGRRCVANVKGYQAILKPVLRNPGPYVIGEFIEPAAASRDPDFVQGLA